MLLPTPTTHALPHFMLYTRCHTCCCTCCPTLTTLPPPAKTPLSHRLCYTQPLPLRPSHTDPAASPLPHSAGPPSPAPLPHSPCHAQLPAAPKRDCRKMDSGGRGWWLVGKTKRACIGSRTTMVSAMVSSARKTDKRAILLGHQSPKSMSLTEIRRAKLGVGALPY